MKIGQNLYLPICIAEVQVKRSPFEVSPVVVAVAIAVVQCQIRALLHHVHVDPLALFHGNLESRLR